MALAYINGQFIPEEKAVIGINDLSIRRGFGIFDFFRTVGLTPLFIEDHLDRFFSSVRVVNLPLEIPREELRNACIELINQNNIKGGGVRIILTGGYSPNSYTPKDSNLIISNEPVKLVSDKIRSQGVKVITHDYQREFPEVKSINYFTGIMMEKKAIDQGGFDVLYHDNGKVREFTRSNVFMVDNNNDILTPSSKILKGITRKHVIELAKKRGYNIAERDFTMNDLFKAKEVFLTGTTKKVLPVIKIDDVQIGSGMPGEISRNLVEDFNQLEKEIMS